LHGFGEALDINERDEFTGERAPSFAEELRKSFHELVGMSAAVQVSVRRESCELLSVGTDSEAEDEPPARQVVEGGRLPGDQDRMVERHHQHTCGEPEPCRASGNKGQVSKWIEVTRGLVEFFSDVTLGSDVIVSPHRLKAESLGVDCQLDRLGNVCVGDWVHHSFGRGGDAQTEANVRHVERFPTTARALGGAGILRTIEEASGWTITLLLPGWFLEIIYRFGPFGKGIHGLRSFRSVGRRRSRGSLK
jgi:hypothetical protein